MSKSIVNVKIFTAHKQDTISLDQLVEKFNAECPILNLDLQLNHIDSLIVDQALLQFE